MRYQVFESGKPADCFNHAVHNSWNRSIYDTYEDALKYAQMWMYPYGDGLKIPLNTPTVFAGYNECTIEIREIPNNPTAFDPEYNLNPKDSYYLDFNRPQGAPINNPNDYWDFSWIKCAHVFKNIKGRKFRLYYSEDGFYAERLAGADTRVRFPNKYALCNLEEN